VFCKKQKLLHVLITALSLSEGPDAPIINSYPAKNRLFLGSFAFGKRSSSSPDEYTPHTARCKTAVVAGKTRYSATAIQRIRDGRITKLPIFRSVRCRRAAEGPRGITGSAENERPSEVQNELGDNKQEEILRIEPANFSKTKSTQKEPAESNTLRMDYVSSKSAHPTGRLQKTNKNDDALTNLHV